MSGLNSARTLGGHPLAAGALRLRRLDADGFTSDEALYAGQAVS